MHDRQRNHRMATKTEEVAKASARSRVKAHPNRKEVDEQSANRMTRGDVLLLLIGYGTGVASDPSFRAHE